MLKCIINKLAWFIIDCQNFSLVCGVERMTCSNRAKKLWFTIVYWVIVSTLDLYVHSLVFKVSLTVLENETKEKKRNFNRSPPHIFPYWKNISGFLSLKYRHFKHVFWKLEFFLGKLWKLLLNLELLFKTQNPTGSRHTVY